MCLYFASLGCKVVNINEYFYYKCQLIGLTDLVSRLTHSYDEYIQIYKINLVINKLKSKNFN